MATFGEVLAAADEEFQDVVVVVRASRRGVLPGETGSDPSVSAALGRMARILTRYTGRIIGDLETGGVTPPWYETARQADRSLREASRALSVLVPSWDVSTAGPLARRLHRAGTALGCGLDLLDTHFATARDGARAARSREALAIAAPDTALHLLAVVGRYSGDLSELVSDDAPRRLLADVATTVAEVVPGGSAMVALTTSYSPPDRVPPRPGEAVQVAIEAARISAHRLIRSGDRDPALGSAATWHYLARSAAIVHDLARVTLQVVAARLIELGAPGDGATLTSAAKQVEAAGRAWRMLAGTLENLSTPDGGERLPVTVDAGDLVMRLGRLAHDDPKWWPGVMARPAQPAKQVPGRLRAAELTLATLRALDAFAEVARAQQRQVRDAAQRGLLWTCGGPGSDPYAPIGRAVDQRLDVRYERIRVAGRRAIRDTARAVWAIKAPEPGPAAEADLIHRRHYASGTDDQVLVVHPSSQPTAPRHYQPTAGPDRKDRPGPRR